jgi:hypothetical protein
MVKQKLGSNDIEIAEYFLETNGEKCKPLAE